VATLDDVRLLHEDSSYHRASIMASRKCGCFYCLATFGPDKIVEWIDYDQTALCPKCGIDSVLGDHSGPLTRKTLEKMRDYWFGKS
jgi:hypothetical protein